MFTCQSASLQSAFVAHRPFTDLILKSGLSNNDGDVTTNIRKELKGSTAYLHLHYLLKAQQDKPVEQPFFFQQKRITLIASGRHLESKQNIIVREVERAGGEGRGGQEKGNTSPPPPLPLFSSRRPLLKN